MLIQIDGSCNEYELLFRKLRNALDDIKLVNN